MLDTYEQTLHLFMICGIITVVLTGLFVMSVQLIQKRKRRSYNDEVVQRLLDEMREQRVRDLYDSGMFNHPSPHFRGKVIKVDFTEVEEEALMEEQPPSALKYKLVYDEHLGIYCKKPR